MVGLSIHRELWKSRRVLITGHTGFKGAWLAMWLHRLGADVVGYALPPETAPTLFETAGVGTMMQSIIGDVRDFASVSAALQTHQPEVVFHLAAQSIVRESYRRPIDTYATNVMGTVHLLEAVRQTGSVKAVVVITSDKCYENRESIWPYRENDRLGGKDPYSSSKACAELVTAAYRHSFFDNSSSVKIATARAGNVVGGGDWARDRLVPDLIRAFEAGRPALIRYPNSIRPWQHVLDPLHGYLRVAESLLEADGEPRSWNFGPDENGACSVGEVADAMASLWGGAASWSSDGASHPHEAATLKLDSTLARTFLGWEPRLSLRTALEWVVEWHKQVAINAARAKSISLQQIEQFEELL